jgi:hypothetical protein
MYKPPRNQTVGVLIRSTNHKLLYLIRIMPLIGGNSTDVEISLQILPSVPVFCDDDTMAWRKARISTTA